MSKEELSEAVWKRRVVGDNVIAVCIAKLRRALGGASNRCILNVYGRGYRFLPSVSVSESAAGARTPPNVVANPPLVGRGAVMQQLEAALTRARSGCGELVALMGEPGIGKTRLVEALEARAIAGGFLVGTAHCHPFRDMPPLWPVLQISRTWGADVAVPWLPVVPTTTHEPAAARDQESTEVWYATLFSMTDAIRQLAANQPRLMVVEDVHWADAASLQLICHWAASMADIPLLIVLTLREPHNSPEPQHERVLDYLLGRARALERSSRLGDAARHEAARGGMWWVAEWERSRLTELRAAAAARRLPRAVLRELSRFRAFATTHKRR